MLSHAPSYFAILLHTARNDVRTCIHPVESGSLELFVNNNSTFLRTVLVAGQTAALIVGDAFQFYSVQTFHQTLETDTTVQCGAFALEVTSASHITVCVPLSPRAD